MTAQPRNHQLPLNTITQVSIGRPDGSRPSAAMARAQTFGWLSVHGAREHVVDVTFDHGRSCETLDLRPALPVILRW
jgi:hypothetical protein